mmetsp:Transcript_42159/g.105417  ORF Transcript_42159/g.105417 Transcript_42159/m.105417 type:complete len:115 (-) Transcript_42159:73-417(-)
MATRNWACVVLQLEGVEEDEAATRVYCPDMRTFDVDTLNKAAKTGFVPLLSHVAASQLLVSANRVGTAAMGPCEDVTRLDAGQTGQQPRFIHAPALPPPAVHPQNKGTKKKGSP